MAEALPVHERDAGCGDGVALQTVEPGDGDTRELVRTKGCHQNSVGQSVNEPDFSTLKRRYGHQVA